MRLKPAASAPLTLLQDPETTSAAPLYRQVYQRVRTAVLAGELRPGTRLPSSRRFALDVNLSRNTVELAFAQLEAEGYLVRRQGSGTYVCRTLPGRPTGTSARVSSSTWRSARGLGVSALSGYYADAKAARPGLIFHYAALAPERIAEGVARLAAALQKAGPQ